MGRRVHGSQSMLYNHANTRHDSQAVEMRRLEAAGQCLFCPPNLATLSGQGVIHQGGHWSVTPNKYPYGGTRHHVLLVPDEHVVDLIDLTPEAQADFWVALRWVRDEFGLDAYGLGVRCGDCRFTGATIAHVHAHVFAGERDPATYQPVRMKFTSLPD